LSYQLKFTYHKNAIKHSHDEHIQNTLQQYNYSTSQFHAPYFHYFYTNIFLHYHQKTIVQTSLYIQNSFKNTKNNLLHIFPHIHHTATKTHREDISTIPDIYIHKYTYHSNLIQGLKIFYTNYLLLARKPRNFNEKNLALQQRKVIWVWKKKFFQDCIRWRQFQIMNII